MDKFNITLYIFYFVGAALSDIFLSQTLILYNKKTGETCDIESDKRLKRLYRIAKFLYCLIWYIALPYLYIKTIKKEKSV